jgi:hypothetical protein
MHIADFTGTTLRGRYRLLRRIGYGGMATVYETVDLQIDKRVAVKVLNPQFSHIEDYIARFRQEALSAARIRHPQLVDVTDFGSDEGLVYFVMELLEGESLGERIHREAVPIPWQETAAIVTQVCEALACAHEHGVIHRDVKPGNVFLVAQPGRAGIAAVKLLDLGVAKVLRDALDLRDAAAPETRMSQGTPGTPEYMAPEQATGQEIDHRIDVYALGVMMYRMLTGNLPFYSPTSTFEVLRMHVDLMPVAPRQLCPAAQIPEPIEAIVLKALAKNPDDRFDSVRALSDALQAVRPSGELTRGLAFAGPGEDRTTQFRRAAPEHRGLGQRLLVPSTLIVGFITSGVCFMLLMLFEIPGLKALAAGRPVDPPVKPRADDVVDIGKDDPELATPKSTPPAPPIVVAAIPPELVPPQPPIMEPDPVPGTPPLPEKRDVPTDPPLGKRPSAPPAGETGHTNGKPTQRPGETTPPKDPGSQARATVATAAAKIGRLCKATRPDVVEVKVTADLTANTLSAQLMGRQNTSAFCVKQKLEAIKPLKKPAQGTTSFTIKVSV